MVDPEQFKQRFLTDQRLKTRLHQATARVEAAEQERIWAIVTAHAEGLSIRKIAQMTGLSSSRVHQLLHTEETRQIAQAVQALLTTSTNARKSAAHAESLTLEAMQQQLAQEAEVLGWCIEWLEQLAAGRQVVVNLRAPTDPKSLCVSFDQSRVVRVLKRIAGVLDELSERGIAEENLADGVDPVAAGIEHRQRLAEPEPQLSSLSQRAQQEILREQLGLPPRWYSRWY